MKSPASSPILHIDSIFVRFEGIEALSGVSLDIENRAMTALVGPNGAGKSTLLNVVSGFVDANEGSVLFGGADVTREEIRDRVKRGIVRSFQIDRMLEGETVEVNILLGRERFARANLFGQLTRSRRYRRDHAQDIESVWRISENLGLSQYLGRSVSELPYGVRRLVSVARVLAAEPALLLLDEPAAGLDAPSRRLLSEAIMASHLAHPVTIIVVEHDIQLVRSICEETVVLDRGRVIARGPTEEVLNARVVRDAYFG